MCSPKSLAGMQICGELGSVTKPPCHAFDRYELCDSTFNLWKKMGMNCDMKKGVCAMKGGSSGFYLLTNRDFFYIRILAIR